MLRAALRTLGGGRADDREELVTERFAAEPGPVGCGRPSVPRRRRCARAAWTSSSVSAWSATSCRWCSRRRAARGGRADHVLLSGPPGLGKTTLAMIIAAELATSLRVTSGPAIQHAGDLAAVLSSLEEGEVLFIDEIHRLARPAEELLYVAMEDFRVDVIVGKGAGASAIPLALPPFTVVGATTRAGLLPAPLRDRFGFTGHLDFYATEELERVLVRSAGLLGVPLAHEAAAEIAAASGSGGTPSRPAERTRTRSSSSAE